MNNAFDDWLKRQEANGNVVNEMSARVGWNAAVAWCAEILEAEAERDQIVPENDPFCSQRRARAAGILDALCVIRTGTNLEQPPEFLAALVEAAKQYGWAGDYVEVADFVRWCFNEAGWVAPDLEPYPTET